MGSETNIEESKFPLQGAEGVKRIYFLGIGGIGMSALARYFNSKGVVVNGYDKTETVLTKQLVKEGIGIHFEDDIKFIDKDADLVVYTPAVPKDHKELNYFLENNLLILLKTLVASKYNIKKFYTIKNFTSFLNDSYLILFTKNNQNIGFFLLLK